MVLSTYSANRVTILHREKDALEIVIVIKLTNNNISPVKMLKATSKAGISIEHIGCYQENMRSSLHFKEQEREFYLGLQTST